MPIRQLQERDLDRITFIAHVGMEYDEVNRDVIHEKTLAARDFDPELGIVYEQDGQVVGFAQGALGKETEGKLKGYVRLLVVDPAQRKQGVGSALLGEIESRLKAKGAGVVSIMDCPQNYFMPGVDFRYTPAYCFLQKHNYSMMHENHNLLCNLSVDAWPELDQQVEDLAREGIEVRRAALQDKEDIFKFLAENWPGWRDEVQGALENTPPTLYIAKFEGQTVAFSGYQGNNKALNWFGPMGTKPIRRGKGLGGLLLRLCLRDLARQGWRTAIIPWVGPVRFYAKMCGAWLDRCFWVWNKDLA